MKRRKQTRGNDEAVRLRATIKELRAQLREANETLDAIRSGEVDALVVAGPGGERVYALKSAEQVYRFLVEHMQEGAATCTPRGMILYANRRLATMLKMPIEKLFGADLANLVPPAEQAGLEGMIEKVAAGVLAFVRVETRLQATDGTSVPVYLSANVIRPEDGPILGLVATDLTERKLAEEALRRSHDELEQRVKERTAELSDANQELQAANEELEVASEELRHQNDELSTTRTALEIERRRYLDLFTLAPDGYVVTDPHGVILEANRLAVDLLGVAEEFLTGKPLAVFVAESEHTALRKRVAELRSGAAVPTWETVLKARDDTHIPAAVRCNAVLDASGKPQTLRWLFRDITERKRAEARLTAHVSALTRMHALSERILEAGGLRPLLQETIDAAVAIMGAERGTLQLLEGDSLRIVAHHGHKQPFLEFFASVEDRESACGEATRRRERVVVPDVEQSPLFAGTPSLAALREAGVRAVQSTPMVSRSGALLGILTTHWGEVHCPDEHDLWRLDLLARQATDLIEYAKADEALRESQVLLRAIMDGTPDPVYVKDRESRILMANPALAKAAGRPLEEIIGKTDSEYYGDAAVGQALREHDVHVMESGQSVVAEETVPTPDGSRTFLSSKAPFRSASGDIVGIIGISRDITERKQAEEALQEAADDLARSNADLEQFAYVASHDLQEPLRMITGYMQLLKQRYANKLDANAGEFIEFAVDGAARMSRLINDLLAYSRVGTRGQEPEPADSDRVLRDVLATLQLAIEDNHAVVTHDPLPIVRADATQLPHLFQNLIANAIKFRGQEPPRIHVGARPVGDMWEFSVSDNGIGIDMQHRDRIFMVFQRLHTREAYAGTGIGLAICKKIVERHGGRIWMESKIGQGSTFYFTLPKADDSSQ